MHIQKKANLLDPSLNIRHSKEVYLCILSMKYIKKKIQWDKQDHFTLLLEEFIHTSHFTICSPGPNLHILSSDHEQYSIFKREYYCHLHDQTLQNSQVKKNIKKFLTHQIISHCQSPQNMRRVQIQRYIVPQILKGQNGFITDHNSQYQGLYIKA